MPDLLRQLVLDRCPYCQIDTPSLLERNGELTVSLEGNRRYWKWYVCSRCGGMVTAASTHENGPTVLIYPKPVEVDEEIQGSAREYLSQAIQSQHAPSGAVMLANSSIDAILKGKGYREGSLYQRINKAAEDHLITEEMARWAHEVRLDANEPRHADEEAPMATPSDANRCIEFAQALAQFLIVLPARVQRGIEHATSTPAVEPGG